MQTPAILITGLSTAAVAGNLFISTTPASELQLYNTAVGTVSSTNASPAQAFAANYWATGGVTGLDYWTIQSSLTAGLNGASTLTFAHTGSTGSAAVQVPLLDIGGTEVGISRLGAASLAIGNGTAGDVTGTLSLTTIDLPDGGSLFIYDATHSKYVRAVYETGGSLYIGSGGATANNLVLELTGGGNNIVLNATAFDFQTAALPLVWNSDTGISRLGLASLAIGNGTAGDFSGNLKLSSITLPETNSYAFAAGTLFNYGASNLAAWSGGGLFLTDTGGDFNIGFWKTGTSYNVAMNSLGVASWTSSSTASNLTPDTGISRLGPGIIGVGTGAATSTAGTLVATTLQLASTSGPTWTSGSAAPSSTPAYGSMYSRTAGGVGLTNLYVYTVAGWVGIV